MAIAGRGQLKDKAWQGQLEGKGKGQCKGLSSSGEGQYKDPARAQQGQGKEHGISRWRPWKA
jgi:hypothetical protein